MKLSEAIRKGCEKTYENSNGNLFVKKGDSIGACALGAGLYGCFPNMEIDARRESEYYDKIEETFPLTCMKLKSLPVELWPKEVSSSYARSKILCVIWFLNDQIEMSREAIAMWVETVEDYFESQKEENAGHRTEEIATECATF